MPPENALRQQQRQRLPDDFSFWITEDALGARVPTDDMSGSVAGDKGIRGRGCHGLVAQFACKQFFLRGLALGNITNVTLDNLDSITIIGITHEFDLDPLPFYCFEREVFVADIAFRLQFREHFLALRDVRERADLPKLLAQKLRMGIAEHSDQIGIDVLDLGGIGIQQQDSIQGGFK